MDLVYDFVSFKLSIGPRKDIRTCKRERECSSFYSIVLSQCFYNITPTISFYNMYIHTPLSYYSLPNANTNRQKKTVITTNIFCYLYDKIEQTEKFVIYTINKTKIWQIFFNLTILFVKIWRLVSHENWIWKTFGWSLTVEPWLQ